jgi:hypothetical protein
MPHKASGSRPVSSPGRGPVGCVESSKTHLFLFIRLREEPSLARRLAISPRGREVQELQAAPSLRRRTFFSSSACGKSPLWLGDSPSLPGGERFKTCRRRRVFEDAPFSLHPPAGRAPSGSETRHLSRRERGSKPAGGAESSKTHLSLFIRLREEPSLARRLAISPGGREVQELQAAPSLRRRTFFSSSACGKSPLWLGDSPSLPEGERFKTCRRRRVFEDAPFSLHPPAGRAPSGSETRHLSRRERGSRTAGGAESTQGASSPEDGLDGACGRSSAPAGASVNSPTRQRGDQTRELKPRQGAP